MFKLIKGIIWLAGLAVIAYLALDRFGYEINRNYFNESKQKCEEKLKQCSGELIKQGTENAKCDFNCVEPKLIIKKKQ